MKSDPFDVIAKYKNPTAPVVTSTDPTEGRVPPQPITVAPLIAKKPESAADPTEGRIIAVLISSEVFGADIWFALDGSFNPDDGLAVFYADELPFLATKDAQKLRKIYETKLAFGPGSRVRQ